MANASPGRRIGRAHLGILPTLGVGLPRLWSVVVLTAVLCAGSPGTSWGQSTVDEYRVKAAFLFHFAQLVEWPADALSEGGNSLLLCTLGEDPFYGDLENTVEGKPVGSRVLRIRHVNLPQETRGCNMIFVGKKESKQLPALLGTLRDQPVLTVGEADGFLGAGGMIRFCREGNKVRFEINREAAESARLRISSQLLLLAKNIVGRAK
jgi:hypothetical protein